MLHEFRQLGRLEEFFGETDASLLVLLNFFQEFFLLLEQFEVSFELFVVVIRDEGFVLVEDLALEVGDQKIDGISVDDVFGLDFVLKSALFGQFLLRILEFFEEIELFEVGTLDFSFVKLFDLLKM